MGYAQMAQANALAAQNLGIPYGRGTLNDRYPTINRIRRQIHEKLVCRICQPMSEKIRASSLDIPCQIGRITFSPSSISLATMPSS